MRFVPVRVADETRAELPARAGAAAWAEAPRSSIEIEFGDVRIRVNGLVDVAALGAVMAAVRAAT